MKIAYKKSLKDQGFTEKEAEAAYETFEAQLRMELLHGDGRVTLQGIGALYIKSQAARKARNLKTGQSIDVPARLTVKFKTAAILKKELNAVKKP